MTVVSRLSSYKYCSMLKVAKGYVETGTIQSFTLVGKIVARKTLYVVVKCSGVSGSLFRLCTVSSCLISPKVFVLLLSCPSFKVKSTFNRN